MTAMGRVLPVRFPIYSFEVRSGIVGLVGLQNFAHDPERNSATPRQSRRALR